MFFCAGFSVEYFLFIYLLKNEFISIVFICKFIAKNKINKATIESNEKGITAHFF